MRYAEFLSDPDRQVEMEQQESDIVHPYWFLSDIRSDMHKNSELASEAATLP